MQKQLKCLGYKIIAKGRKQIKLLAFHYVIVAIKEMLNYLHKNLKYTSIHFAQLSIF